MHASARVPLTRLRTAFISDVHLGTKDCRAELLLEFLESVQLETLVLVGDIFDIWSMRKKVYWPQIHNDVVRAILGKAKRGTRVIYVPGNHDEVFRELDGTVFGNLEIHREHIHVTAEGRRLLVLHGDEFDGAVRCSRWLEWLGNRAYDFVLWLNHGFNSLRRLMGFPYWSLASYLKHKIANAVEYIGRFEQAAAHAARRRDVDGVICGHIHRAALREIDGVLYCNDGDWVESCSTLVEDLNGRLALWNWMERRAVAAPVAEVEPAGVGEAA